MGYLHYLKHGRKILFKKNITPEFVTFFITDKCNFRCPHCFYYNNLNKTEDELNLDEINKISIGMPEFLLLDITGGEPFIRDDVSDIVKVFHKNNKIRNAIIVSNGWFTDKIVTHIEKILYDCPDLHLLLDISIDAIGEEHDRIRGVNGAYKRLTDTFKQLDRLREKKENFRVGIVTTYSTLNQNKIIDIYNEAKNSFCPDTVKISLVRGNPKEEKVKNIDIENYIKVYRLIEKDLIKGGLSGFSNFAFSGMAKAINILSYKVNIELLLEKKFISPCFAGLINVIISSNGDIYGCEILDSNIGSFRESNYDFKKIWNSKRANDFRKYVKDTRCFCTHECNLYTNILFNIKYYPEILKYISSF